MNLDITWMTEAKSADEMLSMEEVLARMEERVKTIQAAFATIRKELGNEF